MFVLSLFCPFKGDIIIDLKTTTGNCKYQNLVTIAAFITEVTFTHYIQYEVSNTSIITY